ncbi:hypothetical protein LTR95_003323 [Oleoguttula sp. CCFEE 5521]
MEVPSAACSGASNQVGSTSLEDIPSEICDLLFGLAQRHISSQDLFRWYEAVHTIAQSPTDGPPEVHNDNLPTIHYDADYEHDRVDLHGVEPGTDSLDDDLVPPIASGTSFSHGLVNEPSGTLFCPYPGCIQPNTYKHRKDWKRHAESHWVEYICAEPGCRRVFKRLDHYRHHHRKNLTHACNNERCTHINNDAMITDQWQVLGCGFCLRLFPLFLDLATPLHASMRSAHGDFMNHVFEHLQDGCSREQWNLTNVMWSLLSGPIYRQAWSDLVFDNFHCSPDFAPPIFWVDTIAIPFIQRLQRCEPGEAIWYELLNSAIGPSTMRHDANLNAHIAAPPFAMSVMADARHQARPYSAATLMSLPRSHTGPSNAYTDISFSQQLNASLNAISSPPSEAVSPGSRISRLSSHATYISFSEQSKASLNAMSSPPPETAFPTSGIGRPSSHDEHRPSSDLPVNRSWTHGDLCEEPVAETGTEFNSTYGTDMRPHEVYNSDNALTQRRRGNTFAARIARIIARPARTRSYSPASDASGESMWRRANSLDMSWTEKIKPISRESTRVLSLRKDRRPTD